MKHLIRALVQRRGYVLWKRDCFRFGISPFVDMARLNATWGRSLKVLFDVGANAGQFARDARRELPGTKIYSFEPHPDSFERLSQSGEDALIERHCLALSDKRGEAVLYEYSAAGEGSHLNSLVPNARFPVRFGYKSRPIEVSSSTIDDFCAAVNISCIDFLKIDVEGAELSVLKGGAGMLARGRILAVYFEFNDLAPATDAAGGSLMPIANYLGEFGLRYACTYTDSLLHGDQLHIVANALFVLPPAGAS